MAIPLKVSPALAVIDCPFIVREGWGFTSLFLPSYDYLLRTSQGGVQASWAPFLIPNPMSRY